MIFLALAIACSTTIAVIFKVTEGRYDRVALLTVNYAAALAVAAVLVAGDPPARGLTVEIPLLALGIFLGALFIGGFVLFSKAIGVAGISLATATMRLSVALPFLASWFIWGEVPGVGPSLGLLLAAGAFVLISRPSAPVTAGSVMPDDVHSGGGLLKNARPVAGSPDAAGSAADAPPDMVRTAADAPHGIRSTADAPDAVRSAADAPDVVRSGGAPPLSPAAVALLLALLFLAGGLVDISFKLFEEEFAAENSRSLFLLVVFGVAWLIGAVLVAVRRLRSGRWPASGVIGWGVVLGVVNYGSAEFMLLALSEIPGTVAFPANNVAVVALATFLGIVFWKETPSRANRLGLLLALVALVLLAA